MIKPASKQKTTLIYIAVILLALLAVKWLFEHAKVPVWPIDYLIPKVAVETEPIRYCYTDKQCWQVALYEETIKQGLSFSEFQKLKAIGEAESNWRQFDKEGKVLRGQDGLDTGIFQLRRSFHEKKAREMGLDIDSPLGNIRYAVALFMEEGTRPWRASAKGWR